MEILEQLQKDFAKLETIEIDLLTQMEKHLELSHKVDSYIADKMDTESRTSQEKQVLALRSTDENFNNEVLEMNLAKHRIDLLKNQLSIVSTRQRLADTINRYAGTPNLIEG